jgi:hypothetical protein
MKEKMKIAFIYHKNNIFLTGTHFDNTYYNFFIKALARNDNLEIHKIITDDVFDCTRLEDKFDAILLWENSPFGMPKELIGIKNLKIPIISRVADPVRAKKSTKLHKKWNISGYFHFYHEDFFHEIYPKDFKYKKIFFGLEASIYENIKPLKNRIKNKILLSGAIGRKGFASKIISYYRSYKWNPYKYYRLRNLCHELDVVDYTSTLNHEYVNDKYPKLLEKYVAAIAADSNNPNNKYLENPAAGCLTFMEITKKNRGHHIGFKDGISAIFINEKNYKEKFQEFIDDPDNPKWEKIANEGRQHALKNLNNDKASKSLELFIKDFINNK